MTFKHKLSSRLALIRDHAGAFLILLAACSGGDQTGLDDPAASASQFAISPQVSILEPGQTGILHAVEVDATGDSLPVAAVWRASGGIIRDSAPDHGEVRIFHADSVGEYVVIAEQHETGGADTARIIVTANSSMLKSLFLVPAAVAVSAGASQQFQVYGRTDNGDSVSAEASLSSTGGAVSSTGLFTAGSAAGTFRVIAAVGGLADTSSVTIASPDASLTSSVVELKVRRFDGRSGEVLVSNGIPLPPGRLRPGELANVRLLVEGQEQRIYVEALEGRHPDGSLRSILVQFRYNIPGPLGIPAELQFGVRRATLDIAKTDPPSDPPAVALPVSPAYLVSTLVGGRLTTAAQTSTFGSLVAAHDADFGTLGDVVWSRVGASLGRGTAVYEHAFTAYQYWLRTGNPVWWQRATAMAVEYRSYVQARGKYLTPWMSNSEELAVHYLLTGDERTRTALGSLVEAIQGGVRGPGYDKPTNRYWIGGTLGDDRMRARALMAAIDAKMINVPDGKWYTSKTATQNLNDLLPTQRPDGRFGGTYYLDGQKNFMVGMLLTTMTRYYDEVAPDPRIPPAVKKALDYMWAVEWNASAQGFRYISKDHIPHEGRGTHPEPGLNGLMLPAYGWYYRYSGDSRYKTIGEQLLQGLRTTRTEWTGFAKQFDEAYYRVFDYFADRR